MYIKKVVLSKCDRGKASETTKTLAAVQRYIWVHAPSAWPAVFTTSAKKMQGISELRASLLSGMYVLSDECLTPKVPAGCASCA